MIAGRLRWREPRTETGLGPKTAPGGASSSSTARCSSPRPARRSARRCSWCAARPALAALDPGGIEPLDASLEQFHDALTRENHTLKRALTDPHLFSGIGNAYSDEILHAARLSPLKLSAIAVRRGSRCGSTRRRARRSTLWIDRLRQEAGGGFPEKVTAFRDDMAVHGRFKQPCPGLRLAGAADRLRRERVQLLRDVPDRRPPARRSLAVAAAEGRLAAVDSTTERSSQVGSPDVLSQIEHFSPVGDDEAPCAASRSLQIRINRCRFIDVRAGLRALPAARRRSAAAAAARAAPRAAERHRADRHPRPGAVRRLAPSRPAEGRRPRRRGEGRRLHLLPPVAGPARRRRTGRCGRRSTSSSTQAAGDPRSAPTRRGCRKCCGCARRTSTRTAAPTRATRGSSCPAGAGRPGRARSACCCRR